MAEPKKETVRIALPPRAAPKDGGQNGGAKETARIVLPSRTPAIPPRRVPPTITPSTPAPEAESEPPIVSLRRPPIAPPSPLLRPLPKPPGTDIAPADEAASSIPSQPAAAGQISSVPSVEHGPKKETARITILPKPVVPPKPAVNMTKTQPLIMRPAGSAPASSITVVTSRPVHALDSIPRSYCWGLLGISALLLLLQVWNYFSS